MHDSAVGSPGSGLRAGGFAHYRWLVCALLFAAAAVNYIDRQVIGILKPVLVEEFGWSDERIYAAIVFTFQLAYAVGLFLAGMLVDRLGVRRTFALSVGIWSLAALGHGVADQLPGLSLPTLRIDDNIGASFVLLSGAAAGLALMRLVLGLGEAAAFPTSIKAVAEWFPARERALATGIFNAGTNVGALLTPIVVPLITVAWGWRWAFLLTGALGFVWLVAWLLSYRDPEHHPRLTKQELDHIRSDPVAPSVRIPWLLLLRHRQTWAFALAKFLTDPIWWVYLFWIPDFLNKAHGLDIKSLGPPLVVIYLVADVGSIGGGWLSSYFIRRGFTVNSARKIAMLVCATAVVPVAFASEVSSLWTAVALVALAAAAHQGWSANLFTLASDLFPRHAVGSVVGIGGTAGAVGGMLIALVVGAVLQTTGSYAPVFALAGSTYLVALALLHLIVPRLSPVMLARDPSRDPSTPA